MRRTRARKHKRHTRRLFGAALKAHQKRLRRGKRAAPKRRHVKRRRSHAKRRYMSNPRRHAAKRRTRKGTRAVRGKHGRKLTYRAVTARLRRGRRIVRGLGRTLVSLGRHTKKYNFNRRRRHFRRNGDFTNQLKSALKTGGIALGGFLAHRAVSKLLNEQVLAKISFFQTNATLSPYQGLIAAVVTAAAGIPLASKFLPGEAKTVAAGMVVSLAQELVLTVLSKLGDTGAKLQGYFSAYQDDAGHASRFSGYGSYYTLPGGRAVYPSTPRMGVGEYLQSARTGLLQAPAGFGSPLLQAAAGMGEYEMVTGYSGMGYVDEGVAPNLAAAEQALNVAEAAAGFGDLSSITTFNPATTVVAVPDEPGGSRAGTLAGAQGIFGA